MNYQRAFPVFSTVFVLCYALCFWLGDQNLLHKGSLFAYYPALTEFHFAPLTAPAQQTGPAMMWYGWTFTSAVVGAIAAVIAAAVPVGTIWQRLVVAAPIITFLALAWMERDWFLRS